MKLTMFPRRLGRWLHGPWRVVGGVCVLAGAYAAFLRFTQGLGASTNLSDDFPWGLWIGFDVLCGVGLAAGGFTINAMVHVFRLEAYRPIARPAVLTAFIGYLLVIGGLMFDLGHPWRIWHALIMWNPHSVMFEVAWCVMLYTIVLGAEVSAMVFERVRWVRAAHVTHVVTLPLVVAAVVLSMLHQSSLGSLFLIVPGRLHDLWYTPLLPLLFFVSAVGVGLAMAIVESNLSARAFGRAFEADVLRGVARMAAVVLGIYVVLRLTDMARRGAFEALWPVDRAAAFFLIELCVGFVIPLILFSRASVRRHRDSLYYVALLAIFGFVVNRLNVAITGFEVVQGKTYVPAWTEVAVTLMLVTGGVTTFYLAARHLPVFEKDRLQAQRARSWRRESELRAGLNVESSHAPQ